ncbi:phage tail protein [Actinokineospora globicatena]|uniref:phage tail protein n=1 Tax=Actinokineospora globicatena TaxID=103729 RepID=UPI0020A4D38E|nr:phage tail protein [Actinokineospora globicatena]MCP2306426.1 phage tail protein domain-containing protein [Actinokineospora globicatena]GLW81850.1 phage tail protein [Actinokineospora globicatena]GLW88644.1 phage tail protein [Actinokineospora globicatena]
MRTAAADVPVRHPIGDRLPAIYAENDFTQRFTAALDEVIAPLFAVLDSFADYLDPALAAPDFLDWLCTWVAVESDEAWSAQQRRDMVGAAVATHRRRGTAPGIGGQLELLTGGQVEITDSGGCVVRAEHGGPLPGTDLGEVRVLVRVADPSAVDVAAVRAAVTESVPVHLRVTVEVVGGPAAEHTHGSGS